MADHVNRYRKGCRCDDCKAAHNAQCREYRAAMVAKHGCIPSQRHRKDRTRKNWTCAECGKPIRSNAGNAADGQILCKKHRASTRRVSRTVRLQRKRDEAARGTAGKRVWVGHSCTVCTVPFVGDSMDRCCSSACSQVNRADKIKAKYQRRRARKVSAFRSNVSPRQVFKRDGYRCHICGKKTRPDQAVPHPRAPTIDHVIPLAFGGTHEPLNCRTACFMCNATKSDKGGGEQLLLIA